MANKITFKSSEDLDKNWIQVLGKPENIKAAIPLLWNVYQALCKHIPHQGKKLKVEKCLYKYGIIADKSFFNGPNKYWEVFTVTHLISNEVVRLRRDGSSSRHYYDYLFIKGHGLYYLGGSMKNWDVSEVPAEFQQYAQQ